MPVILALKESLPLIGGHDRPFIPYCQSEDLDGVLFPR